MKGLLDQPTEILCRVVHYLSPWDIEAFTSTHSLLRGVGSQALAVHCEKKRRFAHLELGCNETIGPLDLISDLLEHEENVEYIQSLSVGYDDAIKLKDSKTSPDKIVHLLARYPNLKAKAEYLIKRSYCNEEMTFPTNAHWDQFPHLYNRRDGGYVEDISYFLVSLSSNLKLLRMVDEHFGFLPLQYLNTAPNTGLRSTAVPSCHLQEVRLHALSMAHCFDLLNQDTSLEILKAQEMIDDIDTDDIDTSWKHPSLHTIVIHGSDVSTAMVHKLLDQAEVLRSFTYCYDNRGRRPLWEPHKTLTFLSDIASDRLVHLDMTYLKRDMSPLEMFDGLQLDLYVLHDFKVLRTLRLESILLFTTEVKGGARLPKTCLSAKKSPLKFKFEMGPLRMQQLAWILPDSATKASVVGDLYREHAVATTEGLAEWKEEAFSELVLEGVHSKRIKEIRQAIQGECDDAEVSLRIFPTRLDASPEVWWKVESDCVDSSE